MSWAAERSTASHRLPAAPRRTARQLDASVEPIAVLDDRSVGAMFELYQTYYAGTTRALFETDLREKHMAVILREPSGALAGFSTLAVLDAVVDGRRLRAIYSGDTIIHHDHWGTQALAFTWIRLAGTIKAWAPQLPLHWFLIVKGHRTYRYLSAFSVRFYPHWQTPTPSATRAIIGRARAAALRRRLRPRARRGVVSAVARPSETALGRDRHQRDGASRRRALSAPEPRLCSRRRAGVHDRARVGQPAPAGASRLRAGFASMSAAPPMRIALLSPKGPLYRNRGGIFKKSLRYQPLTLTTLAALAPPELNAQFSLYDEGIGDVPLDLDADLVGITLITGSAPRGYELARHFRARGRTVVLGGPHVTLVPEEAMQHADSICVGYAEETWPQLLRDFAAGQMRRRYDQGHDFALTNLPFPRRDLLDRRHFLTQAVFEATRACAHDCEFCVVPTAWGRRQFQKPVGHVVEDIRRVGQRRIIFIDLNLISDRAYAAELFEALIPLEVRWFGLATSLIGRDPELMQLMARSGCAGLLIGLESICEASLGDVRKRFNEPSRYRALIGDLHALGISIQGCFVFGHDHDTTKVFDETVQFAIDAAIDLPRFAILTPFPGTPLHRRLDQDGRILSKNWELYDGQHVVFRPKQMTPQQLQAGHERAWRQVYSYGAITRRLGRSRTQLPIAVMANLGYRYYAHHLETHYTCDWPIGFKQAA